MAVGNKLPKEANILDYTLVLICVAIWAGSFAAMKVAVQEAHPAVVVWFRMIICVPILFIGAKLRETFRLPQKNEIAPLCLMGFQGLFLVLVLQSYAMKTASAATANWIIICSPAFVAILGMIFLKEKMSLFAVAGLFLAAVGVTVVLLLGTVKNSIGPNGGAVTIGDGQILFSALNWSAFLVMSRKFISEKLDSAFVIFWEMFFAMAASTIHIIILRFDISCAVAFSPQTWISLFFLGAGSSAVSYFFWFHGLSVLPVSKIVVFQFLQPFVGALIAYFLLCEHFTLWLFIGGCLITMGVWMVNKK